MGRERESGSVCLDFVKWLVLGLLLMAFWSGLLYIVTITVNNHLTALSRQ
jgi:hypothetical protein